MVFLYPGDETLQREAAERWIARYAPRVVGWYTDQDEMARVIGNAILEIDYMLVYDKSRLASAKAYVQFCQECGVQVINTSRPVSAEGF